MLEGFTSRTDQDQDYADPNLPLWEVVHDLYSTDLTQETRPTDHADFAAPTLQHELDHLDQESICLGDVGHELYRE